MIWTLLFYLTPGILKDNL